MRGLIDNTPLKDDSICYMFDFRLNNGKGSYLEYFYLRLFAAVT